MCVFTLSGNGLIIKDSHIFWNYIPVALSKKKKRHMTKKKMVFMPRSSSWIAIAELKDFVNYPVICCKR